MPVVDAELTEHGPLIDLLVGVSIPHAKRLLRSKMRRPDDVAVRALLDTGSDGVVLDHSVAAQLRLLPTGIASIQTASTFGAPHEGQTYDARLWIAGKSPILLQSTVEVFDSSLAAFSYQLIIGRSILDHCCLTYDGRGKTCTLDFDIQAP
jgi:hypothetical protein